MVVRLPAGLIAAVAVKVGRPAEAAEAARFELLDADSDGVISRAEFAKLATMSGVAPARRMSGLELAPGAEVGADGAYVDCPCIDHVGNATWAAHMGHHVIAGSTGDALAAIGQTFPRDYGSTCRAWDEGMPWDATTGATSSGLAMCNATGAHERCRSAWCYVDGSQCQRWDATVSALFPSLHLSYNTCGDLGSFSDDKSFVSLMPVYAGDLTNRGTTTRATRNPPRNLRSNLRMSLGFAYAVLEGMGIQQEGMVQYRELSNASLAEMVGSSYSACVYDIAIGNLDLCMGDWWFTPIRARMRVDFIPVFSEVLRLVVPTAASRDEPDTVWESISKAFRPFTGALWAVILATLCVASIVMAVVEGGLGEFEGLGRLRSGRRSLYLMMLSFASYGLAFHPVTPGGKVLGVGTALFLTIAGACFTANTAQFLLLEAMPRSRFRNLDEFLNAGQRVCFDEGIASVLTQQDNRLVQFGVAVPSGSAAGDMLSGAYPCDGGIVSEMEIFDSWGRGELCGFEFVGIEPLTEFPTGFYVSRRLLDLVRQSVVDAQADGTLQTVFSSAVQFRTCDDQGQTLGPRQLTASHLLGSNLIFLTCCVAALVLHCACQAHATVKRRLSDPDSSPAEAEQIQAV